MAQKILNFTALEYELTKLLISNVGSSYSLGKLVPHKTRVKRKGKINPTDRHQSEKYKANLRS